MKGEKKKEEEENSLTDTRQEKKNSEQLATFVECKQFNVTYSSRVLLVQKKRTISA